MNTHNQDTVSSSSARKMRTQNFTSSLLKESSPKTPARFLSRILRAFGLTTDFQTNSKAWDITEIDSLPKVIEEVLKVGEDTKDGALVLALHGDLGAGKTTFTQTLAKVLGVTETVTSPTFVIMKNYATENKRWSQLVHIDAYRLDAAEELQILGFADWLKLESNIVCVEWAEKVAELLPRNVFDLTFSLEGERRTLTLTTNHDS